MSIILPPPPPPPQKQDKIDEEAFLSFIREKFQNADPIAKQKFADKIEGVDFEVSPTKAIEEDREQSYFIDDDSKECGLTEEEYQFLLDDIEFQIAEANRKYGYGGYGFVDRFGNHYRDPRPRTVPESDLALKRLEKEKGVKQGDRDNDRPRKPKPEYKFKHKFKPMFATSVSEKKTQGVNSNG